MSFIKNRDELATTKLRADALDILEAGYQEVRTEKVIRAQITLKGDDICIEGRNVCLTDYDRIYLVAVGKCAVDASRVFDELIGERITDGVVLDVKHGIFKHLRSFVGSHPFPSDANVGATESIVSMLTGLSSRDLVFVVVSGGGSALLCLPHEVKCETLELITKALWKNGATVHEVNTVRKHLSDIQGGQLAKLAYPATVVSFIFSDVPGNDLSVIASGPTVMDTTTKETAAEILVKYDVLKTCQLPDCELVETPKEPKYFARVMNVLIATNHMALVAMKRRAASLGYTAWIASAAIEGEARDLGGS